MQFQDLLQETYFALKSNKSRSVLTILGIVIGIGSVIAMIYIGQGAAKNIQSNIESLGSNLLVVMPGSQRGVGQIARAGMGSATTLTMDDAKAIQEQVEYVAIMAPTVTSRKQVKTTQGANTNTSIYGVTDAYAAVKNIEMEQGSFINTTQVDKNSKVAVIGPATRDDLFGEAANPIGQKIRIAFIKT